MKTNNKYLEQFIDKKKHSSNIIPVECEFWQMIQ